jgi:hypothetical protein
MKFYIKSIEFHPNLTRYLFGELKITELFTTKTEQFQFNSTRKINKGYFPVMVEICNIINNISDPFVKSSFTTEWATLIDEKITPWLKLFERKLCVPEQHLSQSFAMEDDKPANDSKETGESDNPFGKKDDIFGTDMNVNIN